MGARISPLRLAAFEALPKHARRCVFWEVDPATVGEAGLADPEFEKEAWLSMVMLEWGSCGQVAEPIATAGAGAPPAGAVPEPACVGYSLYAPPRAVPRARYFPSGPVSADAVLLTTLGVESASRSDDLCAELISSVVADLVRRGVRALEAFGRRVAAHELIDPAVVSTDLRSVVAPLGDCSFEHCIIDADVLADAGFTEVSPHRYFPRLRLELHSGLGWKADVEAALERLLDTASLASVGGSGRSAASVVLGVSGQGRPTERSTDRSWASSSAKV